MRKESSRSLTLTSRLISAFVFAKQIIKRYKKAKIRKRRNQNKNSHFENRDERQKQINNKVWLIGVTAKAYIDGTSVYSPIRRTGEARDRTCDPWFTRRVTKSLHHGGF